jgi:hypothetical protein
MLFTEAVSMQSDLLIAAFILVIAVVGLFIVTRPHPVKIVKRDISSTRGSNMRGWGQSE